MKAAVIVSLKDGLHQFIFRDLVGLIKRGNQLTLFPIRRGSGLYNPPNHWKVHQPHPAVILLKQPYYFIKRPLKYFLLLFEALFSWSLVDMILAFDFVEGMRGVEVIYAYFGDHKFFVGYYCKKIIHKPLVVSIQAYELYVNPNWKMFHRALRYCDKIITTTEYNKQYLMDKFNISAKKIDVVRLMIDLEDFKYEPKFKILIVAFFAEKKGHEILFNAIRKLNKPDVEVWVVGDELIGNEHPLEPQKMAHALGLESQVVFFGALSGNALKTLYRECDVFCLPSRTASDGDCEGFPNVLAEAMAFGKPVISTRHVEIPRIVEEILVEENDVDGLVNAIERVYNNRDLIKRLGEKNRKIAERFFSEVNIQKLEEVLVEVTNGAYITGS